MPESESKFESWCIVEVMGHKRLAGFVTEQALGGASFIRVDVPECEGAPAFTQLLGGASIYCITPCTEEVARRAVKAFRARPVEHLDLSRALPAPRESSAVPIGGSEDEDGEDGDEWGADDDDVPPERY